jgi:hypothetical protein
MQGSLFIPPQNEALSLWPLSGWYDVDSIRVEMYCTESEAEIRYTLDGSLPDTTSRIYNGAFWLNANPADTFYFAGIRTNPESSSGSWRWKPPMRMPHKNNIITACAFKEGKQVTPYYHRHLFLERERHHLDVGVVSVSTDPGNLFDHDRGIYVAGKTHEDNPVTSWPWGTGNYHNRGRKWERVANIAFFEANGSLAWQQDLGIRIHGGGSRALPMKSLRLYARSIYGESRINYPFFPERDFAEYNRILLRNSGQDFMRTMFADAMVNKIASPLGLESQCSRPVVHYINGEYWGVINIRDRIDESFIAYTQGLDEDEVRVSDLSNHHPDGGDPRMT